MKPWTTVHFWWSNSYAHEVKFVRWVRMRMHTGGKDTNKLGVGCVVWSSWMFRHPMMNRRQRDGLRAGYCVLRPYTELYRTTPYYRTKDGKKAVVVRRPKLEDVKRGIR